MDDGNLPPVGYRFLKPFETIGGFRFGGGYRFDWQGSTCLVSGESGGVLVVSPDLADSVEDGKPSGDLAFKLVQRGFGRIHQSRPVPNGEDPPRPSFFMIDLTQACVLRCRYCFRHLKDVDGMISEPILDEICRYILDYCRKNSLSRIDIQAWGGEPTLAWSRILRIHRFFKETDVSVTLCVETCGAVLTPKMAAEAKALGMRMGVSIDGPPDLHDAQRPFAGGGGSSAAMLRGLRLLREAGVEHLTSITVVTRKSAPRVAEIVRYFSRELKLRQFKFNLVKWHPGMKDDGLGLDVAEARRFAQDLFRALLEEHRAGFHGVEINVRTRILNLFEHRPGSICLSRGCQGGRKLVSINGAGEIHTCDLTDAGDEPFGNIRDGRDLTEVLSEAAATHPFFRPRSGLGCGKCPWHWFCRGGCKSSMRFVRGGYTGEVDPHECAVNHVLYPELIRLRLSEPGMLDSLAGESAQECPDATRAGGCT